MFKMLRGRHSYPSVSRDDAGKWVPTEVAVDADVMEHESGFRLIRLGKAFATSGIRFRYVRQHTVFDFSANRRHWGGTVTGTYEVVEVFKTGQLLGDLPWPIERATMEAFSADIDAGLRAWPPEEVDETRPIGVIHFVFLTFGGSYDSKYSFAFGEPVALPGVPVPSTRWSKKVVRRIREYTDYSYDCASMVRDDGVQLIRMPTMRGPADDGPDWFHYADGEIGFDFYANRRFTLLIVTDTWEVEFNPRGPHGRNVLSPAKQAALGLAKCQEIVRNIEEGLFAWIYWPGEVLERDTPVNRVVFLDAP